MSEGQGTVHKVMAPGSETLCVLIHGTEGRADDWLDSAGYFSGGLLTKALTQADRSWLATDLYGHGTYAAEEADFDAEDISDEVWPKFVTRSVEAIGRAVDVALAEAPGTKIQVVSYSVGAVVLAQLLARRDDLDIVDIVLAVPTPEREEDDEYSLHNRLTGFQGARTTVLYGTEDEEVDPEETRWFFDLLDEPKELIAFESGHALPPEWTGASLERLVEERHHEGA